MRGSTDSSVGPPIRIVQADLQDSTALESALEGVDTIIHCAGYLGYDEALCKTMNVEGTARLLNSAKLAGASTVVYLSTTAVYGPGAHRGLRENEIVPAPRSVLSRSRLDAEQIVLDFGGVVLRPGLVYGRGDRWVLPSLVNLNRAIGGLVDGGDQMMSVIHVQDLGRMVSEIARRGAVPFAIPM